MCAMFGRAASAHSFGGDEEERDRLLQLAEQLSDPDLKPRKRDKVIRQLVDLGEAAVQDLRFAAARGASEELRAGALKALTGIACNKKCDLSEQGLTAILSTLRDRLDRDESEHVKAAAAELIGDMLGEASRIEVDAWTLECTVNDLVDSLDGVDDSPLSGNVVEALKRMGDSAAEVLVKTIGGENQEPGREEKARHILTRMGRSAVPGLYQAWRGAADGEAKRAAASTLRKATAAADSREEYWLQEVERVRQIGDVDSAFPIFAKPWNRTFRPLTRAWELHLPNWGPPRPPRAACSAR